MKWVAFFSQTGSEIYNISQTLNIVPDVIVTNKQDLSKINQDLYHLYLDRIVVLPTKPSPENYRAILEGCNIATLHGWLRIIPPCVCEEYNIYNSHPAPLSRYPFLKGKDPQQKCFEMNLVYGGNTIHKCIAEVDAGDIEAENSVDIQNCTLDEVYSKVHKAATELWCRFLTKKIKI